MWQNKLEAVKYNIDSGNKTLVGLRTIAEARKKDLKAMDDNKTERENAISALKSSEKRLKEIKPSLDEIKSKSAALRTQLTSDIKIFTACESHVGYISNRAEQLLDGDLKKFILPTRATLSEKVVAIVNDGSYFADRGNVMPLLRNTLAEVERANNWGIEETEVLRSNLDAVTQLLTSYVGAIKAGKRGKDLPAPAQLKAE